MLSLSLIDSGLVLARRNGEEPAQVVAEAPGMAILDEQGIVTGAEAAARVRLKPLLAQTGFWRGLSTAPLTRASRFARTPADIAFAQARSLLGSYKSQEEGVLLAAPAGYTREQLSLLLGVVNETGLPVAGLVDAALAACSLEPAPERVLHLELELHQAILTVLEQTCMNFNAIQFALRTRSDPLHEASSEQRLLDELPGWLAALSEAEHISLPMQFAGRALEIELEREQFIEAVQSHYLELVRLV